MSDEPLRILVVDDHPDTALRLSELLRDRGHDTRVAHDGPDAIAVASVVLPHVVLLDLGLPGMSGYEVAPMIRNIAGLERTRIVAVTGYGSEAARARTRAAGFDAHLTKPLYLSVLDAMLDDVRAGLQGGAVVSQAAPGAVGRAAT